MPRQGQAAPKQVTPANKAAKKAQMLELRAEGHTVSDIARTVGISPRTIRDWKQRDERFAVAWAAAEENYRDFWVARCREYALDPNNSHRHLLLMFLTKQADPSFRDNSKIEHAVSPGLAQSLTKLAKLAESK